MTFSGVGPLVTGFLGVKLTMLLFSILMVMVLLLTSLTTAPASLYALFFALGLVATVAYICGLSVQTDYFPGRELGLSYGLTQTGMGMGVLMLSGMLPLVPTQDYTHVVYMACACILGMGLLSTLLLDQHEPARCTEAGQELLGKFKRWWYEAPKADGVYAPLLSVTDIRVDTDTALQAGAIKVAKTETKWGSEKDPKVNPSGFVATFCHASVAYLLLATFFFAVHVWPRFLFFYFFI
jgi:MFS family permease